MGSRRVRVFVRLLRVTNRRSGLLSVEVRFRREGVRQAAARNESSVGLAQRTMYASAALPSFVTLATPAKHPHGERVWSSELNVRRNVEGCCVTEVFRVQTNGGMS